MKKILYFHYLFSHTFSSKETKHSCLGSSASVWLNGSQKVHSWCSKIACELSIISLISEINSAVYRHPEPVLLEPMVHTDDNTASCWKTLSKKIQLLSRGRPFEILKCGVTICARENYSKNPASSLLAIKVLACLKNSCRGFTLGWTKFWCCEKFFSFCWGFSDGLVPLD